jgi:hypothetical protein
VAKKVILIILGVLLGLCGIGALCIGAGLLGIGGTSGSFKSDYETISTASTGFVSDPTQVENSQDTHVTGTGITLRIQGRNATTPLFFGVGPTAQVDAYLAGSPYEHVTGIDFSPFKITSTRVDGPTQPAAPVDQTFWVARAAGVNPSLSWKFTDGDYEVVLMNADGSPGFQAQTRLGVDAPILGTVAIIALVVGVLAVLGGLALLIWGIRSKRRVPAAATPYPASYGPAGVYPPPPYQSPAANQPPTPEGYQPPAGYQPPPGYETPPSYETPRGYETPPEYESPGTYTPPSTTYPPVPPPPATSTPTTPTEMPPAEPPPAATTPPIPPPPPPVAPPATPEPDATTPDAPPPDATSPWTPPDDPTVPPKP